SQTPITSDFFIVSESTAAPTKEKAAQPAKPGVTDLRSQLLGKTPAPTEPEVTADVPAQSRSIPRCATASFMLDLLIADHGLHDALQVLTVRSLSELADPKGACEQSLNDARRTFIEHYFKVWGDVYKLQ